jgi:pyruvate,water dikinase
MLGFDSAPIRAEKSLFDLAEWARGRDGLSGYLSRAASRDIAARFSSASSADPDVDAGEWRAFCRRLSEHLDRFGHAVYDLDFAKGLAMDDPAPQIETMRYVLVARGTSPHERQAAAAAAREQAGALLRRRVKGLRGRLLNRVLPWAQRYAPLREDALTDVGLGWPVLRRLLRELGRRLAAANAISDREDVFWLTLDETIANAQALDAQRPVTVLTAIVDERRATWEPERLAAPPVALPVEAGMRFLGVNFSRMAPARTDQPAGNVIEGHSASPGRVTASACVIRSPHEFGSMRAGDILVARITTPAWTPLFALAAGIVTDVGGPLSHGSIVAREYHIPAVLGTGVATERIRTADRVTVDGDRGRVTIG